jgi:hypothetical protein
MVESRFELLCQLVSLEVLSPEEHSKLGNIVNVYERNDLLFDFIATKTEPVVYQLFLEALRLTNQKHVANYATNGK